MTLALAVHQNRDLDGTPGLTLSDFRSLIKHLIGVTLLTGNSLHNADTDQSGVVNRNDAVILLNEMVAVGSQIPSSDPSSSSCPPRQEPDPRISFFLGRPSTTGGNLGGITGADARCQQWAEAAGIRGKTWRAYLSATQGGPNNGPLHARHRIGQGPWYNSQGLTISQGAQTVDLLHERGIVSSEILTECRQPVVYNQQLPPIQRDHDILTGSNRFGYLRGWQDSDGDAGSQPLQFIEFEVGIGFTCTDWTDGGSGNFQGWVGHTDWNPNQGEDTWNDAHATLDFSTTELYEGNRPACSQMGLQGTGGQGRIYCFALN